MALNWQGYHHNKQAVVKRLKRGQYEMIAGQGVGLMDRFFAFLREIEFLDLADTTTADGYERVMIPIAQLLLTYQTKILLGISHMNQVPELLFQDIALLRLMGFTARQIKDGYCDRGEGKHPGPFHKDTLANALERLGVEEVERLLNQTVHLLANAGFFPKKRLKVILDATDLETTDQYEGVGSKTVEKRIKDKHGRVRVIEVTVYGWKLILLQEIETRMAVAAKVVPINEHESNYTIALIEQAQANLAESSGRCRIGQVVMDKGLLDGEDLWTLHQQGVQFVVPAKKNMQVTQEAQGFRGQAEDEDLVYGEEETEKDGQTVKTQVYGIKGLRSYDQYGDAVHQAKNRYGKEFEPNPINAVVVTEWKGKAYEPGKEPVFLTDMSITKPLRLIGAYDERSDIENQGFRELKQGWQIGEFPKKTKRAVFAHILLTLIVFNLANGFRTDRGYRLGEKGIRRFRREEMGRDSIHQVIVFAGEWYAVLDVEELMVMLGKPPQTFFRVDPESEGVEI